MQATVPAFAIVAALFVYLAQELDPPAALPFGDILANLVATFAAFGHHSLLWPKATTFEWSQRPYLQLLAAIVRYGQRPPLPSLVDTSIIMLFNGSYNFN